ncbi:hypothetical protein [Alkalihalobacillus sp. BA299]|uniref:hypothetical protein n=1 Tax=Alkalihalobacillus sp. BA299 TaxID=2815938 RepID=UPI001ADCDAA0|nr:hypothetical protein [Alkalihalobacillus sp. BA299]
MGINRNVSIVQEKTTPPFYVLAAEWNINGQSFKGLVAFEDDKMMGKFDLENLKKIISSLPNPNGEVQTLKHMIRDCVYEDIKEKNINK